MFYFYIYGNVRWTQPTASSRGYVEVLHVVNSYHLIFR